jgi:DNA polymerase I-like protein with 3'-5' exonuclease and polymerase domains
MALNGLEWYVEQASGCRWITEKEEAAKFFSALVLEKYRALDFETTSLFPWDGGEVRLSIITDETGTTVIDHFYAGKFSYWAEEFAKRKWVVYNAMFEGRWIDYHTEGGKYHYYVDLLDVQFLKKAKMGGAPSSLAKMAKADLKIELDKTEQNSGWHQKVLSDNQRVYAAMDGVVTWELYLLWLGKLTAEQMKGAMVLNSAWRGTYFMEDCGLNLDVDYHQTLIDMCERKRDTAEGYIRKFTPVETITNLKSGPQIGQFLESVLDKEAVRKWPRTEKTKRMDVSREVLVGAARIAPYPFNRWLAALIIFNKMNKYLSTYGEVLINKQKTAGKIKSRLNMAQAITGRYSSSNSNLQNIPNNPVWRQSFVERTIATGATGATGSKTAKWKMVIADYSSIEVRVLAELSGDEGLRFDTIYGDVHSRSASQIFGIDFDEFVEVLKGKDPDDPTRLNPKYGHLRGLYKSMRTKAKVFTFQLLYGAGYTALSHVLRCSYDEAVAAVEAWAKLYPKAYAYRFTMFAAMESTGYLPVADGRTIFVYKSDRTMPVASNYPVQGAAASVMYRSIYHLCKNIVDSDRPIDMAASVHDENLLFAEDEPSNLVAAQEILEQSMVQGWLDIFPGTDVTNLVEAGVGSSWADKK